MLLLVFGDKILKIYTELKLLALRNLIVILKLISENVF